MAVTYDVHGWRDYLPSGDPLALALIKTRSTSRDIVYLTPRSPQVTSDSIIITDLVKKDTGNYGCNATNSIGYVYKDVYINVQCEYFYIII